MNKNCLLLLLLANLFAMPGKSQAICPTGNILYVKADATGVNNGSSWMDAYTTLQDALANDCPGITQIWVAKGTYYPDEGVDILPDNRSAAFKMKPGISIYGGFAGTEDPNYNLADRDFATNASILSGDLQQNDEDGLTVLSLKEATSRQDNSYNVIYNNQNGLEASDVLDGFTITGGNTNGSSYTNAGAGMSNTGSSPGVRHCKFTNCSASFGGALFLKDASSTITNCSFIRNNANSGAAIYYDNGSPDFINCTIVNNRGISSGGITSRTDVASTFTNCIIWTNGPAAQIITNGLIAPTATNCIVQGGYLNGTNISSLDPMFVNVGDLHLKASSPAVNSGLNGANTLPTDLDGNPRIIGGTIDLGAYESQPICPTGNILYVKADAGGANNGSSWTDAYNSLQDALANACVNVTQIWVAKGTYYPTTTTDRSISFVMKPGIAMYGGFDGTEQANYDLAQRNFAANPTILSGDIDKNNALDDGNSYHVIFNNQNSLDENAKLDGFTITAGYANGGGDNNAGAGMFNAGSSPGISHCAFTQCRAATFGGALYLINASPNVESCSFTNNAGYYGSGIYYDDGSPDFINCSIVNNSGSFISGGIHANTSTVSNITNCIAWGNSGTAQIFSGGTLPLTVTNSIVQGGYAGGTNILSADPLFVDAANGDLRLQLASPAINAGLNGANNFTTDLDGKPRFVGATIDMGAYESQVICPSAGILYVNAAATGANNGSSWADAFTTLQDALVSACPDVSKIWVAKGTYHPDEGGGKMDNDRNAAFVMKNNLAIYGGFAGTEAPDFDLTQRNFAANPTILSGDIEQNDAAGLTGAALVNDPSRADNSYHVIFNNGNNLDQSARLDGFTITAGNANGSDLYAVDGGGMSNWSSAPVVANCSFTNNSTSVIGGGIFNTSIEASPGITNCRFTNNHALAGGAIGNMNGASPKITNSIFNSNLATDGGGIFNNNASNAIITNCSFTNNSGGAIKNISSGVLLSIPVLTNCILWNNTGGQIIEGTAGSVAIATYSIVQGGYSGTGNLDADPLFVDATNGDLHLQAGSPAINTGLNSANTLSSDLDGNARIIGGTIDIGAYESQVICPTDGIIYVKADAGGANNGSSWSDAYNGLQDALANDCPGITQIWVAKGTYYPTTTTDRSISFVMKPGIAMYGGFDGTEQANYNLAQRDFADNASILSGDIGTPGDAADNSYHVVFNNNNGLTTTNALLDGFTITGSNGAVVGGGMLNSASSPTVSNCLFTGNQASNAGAMMNDNCSPTITNCSFNNNESIAEGGAMFNNNNANPVITNCIFAKNKAGTGGGAIINSYNSQPKLINCSIGNNSAGINDRGGIYNYFSSPTIANCIIWGNNNGQIADQAPSQTTVSYSIVQGGFTGTGNLDADPLFVDPSNGDLRLQAGSPAINSGLNSANTLPTDLDGKARIVNGTIDRGAYETPAVCAEDGILYVNAAAALGGDGSSWEKAFNKLQDALANTCPSQTGNKQIWVAKGTYYPDEGGGKTDNARNTAFVMKKNLAIYGGFAGNEAADFDLAQRDFVANLTILSGDIDKNNTLDDGNSYHVIFNNNNALDATAILDGFTITGGNGSNNGNVGGGMLNQNSSPTITNCSFNGNSAEYGGGINNYNSSPTITNCSFTGNSTTSGGGGIYNLSSSSPRITNCSFTGNSAFGGGGMYNDKSSPTVTNCSFYGNSAINGGGGMLNVVGSSPIITNCSFYGNNTSATGGGMLNQNSSPSITNSIIWGNSPDELVNNFGGTAIISYSIVPAGTNGEGNLNVDPLFVDAASGDLHLQLASPAINAGLNSANSFTTDLDGKPRIVGGTIDMGAYESQVICPSASILYVNAAATGANNGSSWTDAYTDLQDALANECPGVTQIWVAKGTYYPTNTANRSISFSMKNGVAIYGGFTGNETSLTARNWKTNATILSGDIDKDGLLNDGNSYNIIFNNSLDGTAVLDGFTIRDGKTNEGRSRENSGAGINNAAASPGIYNCRFVNNQANRAGAAIFNIGLSNPAIVNCEFVNNSAVIGGAVANEDASSQIINCSFNNNNAAYLGSAVHTIGSEVSSITNCIIWGNNGTPITYTASQSPILVSNSVIQGGFAGISNLDADPLFVDATNGNLHLQACSPAIDAGTATGAPATDLDGNARPALGGFDMGAYEFSGTPPTPLVLTCPPAAKVFACGLPGIITTTKLAYTTTATSITEAAFVTAGGSISGTCGVSGISYQDAMDEASSTPDKTLVNRTFTASNISGKTFTCTQVITLQDYTIDATASSKPVAIGTAATLSATVMPAEAGVPVTFYLDDVSKGTSLTGSDGVATLDVSGLLVDVYQVKATVGDCVEGNAIFSVYNPDGGFVTGAGWIISPPGALVADQLITGKANFGLNAKYQKGKDIVVGDTEFKFKAGNFNFKSLSNDAGSLVISGAKATYRGTGTVNDAGDYGFMVVAIDGDVNSIGADRFRIKIWDRSLGNKLVYDNKFGVSEFADDATELGGGAIVIQTPKVRKAAITLLPAATNNDTDLAIKVGNNPSAQGQQFLLQVMSSDKTTPVSIRVMDASGRPVQSWKNQLAGAVLEAGSQWTKGMYMVEALQNDKKVQVKLLKL